MAVTLLLSRMAHAQTTDVVEVDDACVGAPDAGFPDTAGTTFEDLIDCLAWYGITLGDSDGNYRPGGGVRRWQMAYFLYRVAALAEQQGRIELPEPGGPTFPDGGDEGSEGYNIVETMVALGVVEGTDGGAFRADDFVTRAQMAAFISRLHLLLGRAPSPPVPDPGFADVSRGAWCYDDVAALASLGVVQGDGDGRYRPGATVTRAQMAAFIMRMVEVLVDQGRFTPKGAHHSSTA